MLSLTEIIVFTRNGLHTYIHTHKTFFLRYLSSASSKKDFSTNIFFAMNIKNFCLVPNRYNKDDRK